MKDKFEKDLRKLLKKHDAYIHAVNKEVRVVFFDSKGDVKQGEKIKSFGLSADRDW